MKLVHSLHDPLKMSPYMAINKRGSQCMGNELHCIFANAMYCSDKALYFCSLGAPPGP